MLCEYVYGMKRCVEDVIMKEMINDEKKNVGGGRLGSVTDFIAAVFLLYLD